MEKAPGPSPDVAEESKKNPEPPKLTLDDQEAADFRDRFRASLENSGDEEAARTVTQIHKEELVKARERGIDAEIEERKRNIEKINEAVQRGERMYGESAEERVNKEEKRIHELEDMRAGRQPAKEKTKAEEISDAEAEKESDLRNHKTIESDARVPVDKLNERYNKTLEDLPTTAPEKKSVKKERPKDPLEELKPKASEKWEKLKAIMGPSLIGRAEILFNGVLRKTRESLANNPALEVERARKNVDEWQDAYRKNLAQQEKYRHDPKPLAKAQSEEEGIRRGLREATLAHNRADQRRSDFERSQRRIEEWGRTFLAERLKSIDKALGPYEKYLKAARLAIEVADKRLNRIDHRYDAYKERLAEKRGKLRDETDVVQRQALEKEIAQLEKRMKATRPITKRIHKKQSQAMDHLKEGERGATPLHENQRRIARGAGLEVDTNILGKALPPENLPVAPKGVANMAEWRGTHKKPEKIGPEEIHKFVRAWNGRLDPRFRFRISDPDAFARMFGDDKVISPSRLSHVLVKYFEERAIQRGRNLTEHQRKVIEKNARRVTEGFFHIETKGKVKKVAKALW